MPKLVDLSGQRFGYLTVLNQVPRSETKGQYSWLCRCDCGNTKVIQGGALRHGITKSCGCKTNELRSMSMQKTDYSGERFGSYTVLERSKNRSGKTPLWICRCDCGNIREVEAASLLSGDSKSCGCKKKEYISEAWKTITRKRQDGRRTVSISKVPSKKEILSLFADEYENSDKNETLEDFAFRQMFNSYWQRRIRGELAAIRYFERPNKCSVCGKEGKIELHHVRPVREYGGNEPSNIAWLCRACHLAAEGKNEKNPHN